MLGKNPLPSVFNLGKSGVLSSNAKTFLQQMRMVPLIVIFLFGIKTIRRFKLKL
jgi:hypothetical protein